MYRELRWLRRRKDSQANMVSKLHIEALRYAFDVPGAFDTTAFRRLKRLQGTSCRLCRVGAPVKVPGYSYKASSLISTCKGRYREMTAKLGGNTGICSRPYYGDGSFLFILYDMS